MDRRLDTILARLTAIIPHPAPKRAKVVKSFRNLKPNQFLKDKQGHLYEVVEVNSLGAVLEIRDRDQTCIIRREVGPDWPDHFDRARRRRPKLEEPNV